MSEVQAAATTATVEVPAAHESLVQRLVALLKKEEQTVVDNVEAGLTMLENLFKSDDSAPTTDETTNETPAAD